MDSCGARSAGLALPPAPAAGCRVVVAEGGRVRASDTGSCVGSKRTRDVPTFNAVRWLLGAGVISLVLVKGFLRDVEGPAADAGGAAEEDRPSTLL